MENAFFRQECFINGAWIGAKGGHVINVSNPSTGDHIGNVPQFGRKETADAIFAASSAFQNWRHQTASTRAEFCFKIFEALMDNQLPLAELLTAEMGKPLAEAKGEIAYGAQFFKWFGEEAQRLYGDTIPSPWPNTRIVVSKEPVGVVASITPWNFPTAMIARKAAAALAAGCTIVCKPSEDTPFSALAFGVIAELIGLPKGVMNIVTAVPSEFGDEVCENPQVKKLTFTGSTTVGKMLAAKAAKNMKRISMELGGNAPFIVFDDADIDRAVDGALTSKYRNAGQTCVCANRIYVQAGVYDEFAKKFAVKAAAMKVGDGFEDGVEQGPLINSAAIEKVESHIADATKKGATIVTGGSRHQSGGLFFEPTVIRDVTSDMKIADEETFGPVAPLFKFETEEEAIRLANNTQYGLASYFYTQDLGRAWRVTEALEYGMVAVNEGIMSTPVAPFGGVKESGVGREGSKYGLDDYVNIKYALFGGLS